MTRRNTVARVPRMLKNLFGTNQIHRFKQIAPVNTLAYSSALGFTYQFTWNLQQLDAYAQFTSLFDQYRIRKVVCVFRPQFSETIYTGVLGGQSTYNYSAIDYDDANALSDSAIREYDTCQVHKNTDQFTRTIYPRVAVGLYGGSLFNAYGNNSNSQWIDCSNPAVPYYGLKWNTENQSNSTSNNVYFVDQHYYLEFRSVR